MSQRVKNVIALICVSLFLLVGCKAVDTTYGSSNSSVPYASKTVDKTTTEDGEKAPKKLSKGQENAIKSAEQYLDYSGFSKKGLFRQLTSSFEGYSDSDAKYAVNHVEADWNAEAVESAKQYLSVSSFSRQGLINQLTSPAGDRYTKKEATYAATKVGL